MSKKACVAGVGMTPFKKPKESESYLVMAEALHIIGTHGKRSQLKFLDEARNMKSPRNVVSRAASEAIDVINNREIK